MVTLDALAWVPASLGAAIEWPLVEQACPWLRGMAGTPQDPRHHAEGDVLTHTRMVAESLVSMERWGSLPREARARLFVAALLHDVGKPGTTRPTVDGGWESPGHARSGEGITRRLLRTHEGIGAPLMYADRERIAALVRLHGLPIWFMNRHDLRRTLIRSSLRVSMDELAILAEADACGRNCQTSRELLDCIGLFRAECESIGCGSGPFPFANDHARVLYCRELLVDPHHAAFDGTWGEVVVLSGLPGAGKDRWVAVSAAGRPVVSLDTIRAGAGIRPDDEQGQVIAAAKEQARGFLRKRQSFIWNATNVTRRLRDPLIQLILDYGARIRIVYLEAPIERLLARNRTRSEPVPEAVIRSLADKLEPPDVTEAHVVEWLVDD